MPVVPSYDNTTVAPTNLPDVRQQVPRGLDSLVEKATGEQIRLGQAMQQTGAEGMQEIVAQQIQDTESKAKNGSTAYIAGSNAILHGAPGNSTDGTPPDPSTGYLYKNGSDAVDGYKDTVKALADLKQKTLDGMDNNAQRQAVQNALELHYQSAVTMAAEHAAKQRGVRDMADSKTRQSVSIDAAAKSFDPLMDKASYSYDPDKPDTSTPYQQYLHVANVEASTQAGIQGITDPTARTEFVRHQMQGAYAQTFNNILKGGDPGSGQTAIANDFFSAVKDQLDTPTQDKFQSVLNVSGRQDNEVTVRRALEQLPGSFKARYAALNDAFDNKGTLGGVKVDGTVYKAVKAGLENTEAHALQDQNRQEAAMVGQAQDWVLKNPGTPIAQMPRAMYLGLEAKGHLAAMDSFANRTASGDAATDNPRLFLDLMSQAHDDPAGFLKQNITQFYGELSGAHRHQLEQAYNDIGKQDTKQIEANKLVQITLKNVDSSLENAGIKTKPIAGSPDAARYDQFKIGLHDSLVAALQENPNLKPEQARDIALGSLKDQALSGTGYFGTTIGLSHMPVWKMTPDQKAASWAIPDSERTAIMQSLKKSGLPATDANVQRAYKLSKGVR